MNGRLFRSILTGHEPVYEGSCAAMAAVATRSLPDLRVATVAALAWAVGDWSRLVVVT